MCVCVCVCVCVCGVLCDSRGLAQELSEHSPDFRFLVTHLNDVMGKQPQPSARSGRVKHSRPLRLLKAYKIFNRDLERRFVTAGDSTETMRLYMGGDRPWLRQVLEHGRGTDGVASDAPVVLFEDPWHAVAKAGGRRAVDTRHGGSIHGLLQCRACPGTTLDIPGSSSDLPSDEAIAKVAKRIPNGYTAACMAAAPPASDNEDEDDAGPSCFVLRPAQAARVLPEFFLLVSEIGPDDVVNKLGAVANAARGVDSNEAALEASLAQLTRPLVVRNARVSPGRVCGVG